MSRYRSSQPVVAAARRVGGREPKKAATLAKLQGKSQGTETEFLILNSPWALKIE